MTTATDDTGLSRADHAVRRWRGQRTDLVLAALALAVTAALAVTTKGNLLHPATTRAVLQFLAVPIVIGLSQMVVLAVGQMNLSVGVLTGLASIVSAALMLDGGWSPWLAVPVAVLVGTAAGLLNGLLVIATRINGFIVTLATMTIIAGLRYGVNGTGTFEGYSDGLVAFGRDSILGLPVVFLLALAVAALVSFYFRRTLSGRHLLASGGNPTAARLTGISNDKSIVVAHTLSGLLAGVAGVLVLMLSGSVNTSVGDDLLLASFAAPIIGGVALSGGAVSVLGTCLAAYLVRMVYVAQAQYNINPRWVDLVVGAVVLGAVLLSQGRQRKVKV